MLSICPDASAAPAALSRFLPHIDLTLRRTANERRDAAIAAGASPSSAIELLDSPVAHANLLPRQQQQHSRAENSEQHLRQQRARQRAPGFAEDVEEQLQRMWGLAGISEEHPHGPATQVAAQMAEREEQLQHVRRPAGVMDERQVRILVRPRRVAGLLQEE